MAMEQVKSYENTLPVAVQAQERKRRRRRILKIAVYCIFGVIGFGVFCIWLLHRDSADSIRFGSGFIFSVKLRSLEMKNDEGDSVLFGDMGRYLHATPYDHCWDETFESYEESCLHWHDVSRLRVVTEDNRTTSCYSFQWEGFDPEFIAEDCFYLQRFYWYGYFMNTTSSWPISDVSLEGIDYYAEYPLQQTKHLVPVWFGSQGVAIFVDSSYPFKFTWNTTDRSQFCITSKLTSPGQFKPLTLLRYTICTAKSIKEVYKIVRQHRLNVDLNFSIIDKHTHFLQTQPIYSLSRKEELSEFLNLMKRNESECRFIELYDDWEGDYGNLSVDSSMMDMFQTFVAETALHQCQTVLPISTFFSYKSHYYKHGVQYSYFVRDSQNLVTRMIKWRGLEGAVLDVTNPNASHWFLNKIQRLVKQHNVKALKLLSLNLPPDSTYFNYNMTHLDYIRMFYKDMSTLNISLILELTTGFIPLPVYVPIRMEVYNKSDSYCFKTFIPYSLTMSISGFPLLMAVTDITHLFSTTEEIFKLWLQVAIFFPHLEIPSSIFLRSQGMRDFLHGALNLRDLELLPHLTKVWEKEPELPIIRPLWWISPNDRNAQVIDDQFLVGDTLLVAPILCQNVDKRIVYLPEGVWSGCNMTSVKGPQRVEVNTLNFSIIPYFWKEEETAKQ